MEIEFGKLEQAEPTARLRPDRNKHFAVAACGSPAEDDLPIFVDLDVMRDMEDHALSNTGVELGGVLLGGQYVDDLGRPFVLVTDSLRAEHYESTKGSFKFTHDTWQEITRQRDEFPSDLQMVGWYHTHPDWGVFLSGMDTFICDHFFNKPLDVALVIDPCRDERGWFQWTGEAKERIRETAGFYLIASRFRQRELRNYADLLEGRSSMTRDARYAGSTGEGGYSAPIIHIGEPRSSWQAVAVIGMMTMQFLVLALLAWKIATPPVPTGPAAAASREADRLAAQRAVLNEVIGKLEVAPDGLVETIAETRQQNETLQMDKTALMAHVRELQQETAEITRQREQLATDVQRWETAHAKADAHARRQAEQIAMLIERVKKLEGTDEAVAGDSAEVAASSPLSHWWWIGGGIAVAALLAGGFVVFSLRSEAAARDPIDPADSSPRIDDEP